MKNRNRKSQAGFLTVDFMLAMIVTLGCMLLLMKVSLSLVTVQMAQYVAFAVARAQSASDITADDQKVAGLLKYKNLLKKRDIASGFLLPGQTVSKDAEIRDLSDLFPPAPGSDGNAEAGLPAWGARIEVTLQQLTFIPFLGKTRDSEDEYKANVNAMLFREPSQQECQAFFGPNRYEKILSLDAARFGKAGAGLQNYVPMEDSGC